MDSIDRETGEIVALPGIPPAIATAIIAVKKQVKQLGADSRNEHGKYNFVSVDKFYERIGSLMAAAGLAVLINEAHSEVREGKSGNPWLFCRYEITLMHESGALSGLPLSRSLALPINGPQTYGAAQSYVEKQFLRQLFKIPTGERDADETEQTQDAPAGRAAGNGRAPQRQQSAEPSAAKDEATKRYKEIRAEIDASMTIPDLDQIPTMPAWASFERVLREAEASEKAEAVMGQLADRIERRREMLLSQ